MPTIHSHYPVLIRTVPDNEPSSRGTGFFARYRNRVGLVTCRHVLEGNDKLLPSSISAEFCMRPGVGSQGWMKVFIKQGSYVSHPDPNVDLALIVTPGGLDKDVPIIEIPESGYEEDLRPADELAVAGFHFWNRVPEAEDNPESLRIEARHPMEMIRWRVGYVESEPSYGLQIKERETDKPGSGVHVGEAFAAEFRSNYGSSGSPVFSTRTWEIVGVHSESILDYGESIMDNETCECGRKRGVMMVKEPMTQVVWKNKAVRDLFRHSESLLDWTGAFNGSPDLFGEIKLEVRSVPKHRDD